MLLDRSPLGPKPPFDLHTLGTPLAFVLSQDQTLHVKVIQQSKPLETRVPQTEGRIGDTEALRPAGSELSSFPFDLRPSYRATPSSHKLSHCSLTPKGDGTGRPYCRFPLFSFQGTSTPLCRGPGPNLRLNLPSSPLIREQKTPASLVEKSRERSALCPKESKLHSVSL